MKSYMIAAAVSVTGCTTVPATEVPISAPFNKSDVVWFDGTGAGTLKGSAFLRTNGGAVKTCAGYDVQLLPYSPYAAERMRFIYGSDTSGNLFGPRRAWKFTPDEPEFYKALRKTVCDANGEFEFDNLPNGDYFVIAKVTWDIGNVYDESGTMMEKVSIANGATEKVTLTAN